MRRPWLLSVSAFLGYLAAALAFTWPLPRHLSTHVLGPVSGDTGVYIWNLWAFAHEVSAGRFPLFTSSVFSSTPPVDLSLHNYTIAFNVAAWPLLTWLPPVVVYNLLTIGALALNAWAGFVLVRRVTDDARVAWLGGLVFGFSPYVIARTAGHLSLVLVAPLAVFWLALDAWRRDGTWRRAVGTGLAFTWALFTDPYYAVFCVLMAVLYVAPLRAAPTRRDPQPRITTGLDVGLVVAATLGAVIAVTGGWVVDVAGTVIRMTTAYTPMLVATVLALVRVAVTFRWRVRFAPERFGYIRPGAACASAAAALLPMSPWLYALAHRIRDGGHVSEPVLWRSSVPGVDVMGLLVPNPGHVLMRPFAGWFAAQPAGEIEHVAAVPWVACAVIAVAAWRYREWASRWWVGLTVVFGLLALGPFVHIAGANTFVPGPWALLRYVPILSSARSPSRFAAVVTLGLAVLFGLALARWLAAIDVRRRRAVYGVVAAALVAELTPLPRPLYSASVPGVYDVIAQDPRPVSVLHLPFGLRDGTQTIGRFDTARLYYQTRHEKAQVGGYISRLSRAEIGRQRESRVIRALLYLSEGGAPLGVPAEVRRMRGARFVRRVALGYVVVDRARATADVVRFAAESFGLEKVATAEGLDLYRVPPYEGPDAAQNVARWRPNAEGVTQPGSTGDSAGDEPPRAAPTPAPSPRTTGTHR